MYTRYAEHQRWKVDVMSATETDGGGFREIIFEVKGGGAYSYLRYESGVHRVQRVPVTESQGRIHTSTASVAVLPEAEEVDVQINDNDLRIDVFRSTGHGGQSVNTTDSAVRITHLPTGIVVSMQDEKSLLKNKTKAMRCWLATLRNGAERMAAGGRRPPVADGTRRSEKIPLQLPAGCITDHRIKKNVSKFRCTTQWMTSWRPACRRRADAWPTPHHRGRPRRPDARRRYEAISTHCPHGPPA